MNRSNFPFSYDQTSAELRRRKGSESESSRPMSSATYVGVSTDNETSRASTTPQHPSSVARDRTREFEAIVSAFRSGPRSARSNSVRPNRDNHAELTRQSVQFMTIARSIGRDISNTYVKLEKLTLLARRKTIFDDRPEEIEELTHIIKEDMNALNRQINQLQHIAKTQQSTLRSKHQASHSSGVLVSLQSKLVSMTNDFKTVLEVRTENLKEGRTRQEKFTQGVTPTSLPHSVVDGYHKGSVLALSAMDDEENHHQQANGDFAISMDGAVMQMADTGHLHARANTMQNIESTIVELGGIFQQLAHMIKDQEEVLHRIDANVDDATMSVEAGHEEILKYFKSVTSNRFFMIKVFAILIVFFIFFVVFMA